MKVSDLDVVILCGGQGTRLRPVVSDRPKVLAPIGGRTYLDVLLTSLARQGVKRAMLCGGYLSEVLTDWCRSRAEGVCRIALFNEADPHGTASAMRFMRPFVRSEPVLVINGDTLVSANLNHFLQGYLDYRDTLTPPVLVATLVGKIWQSLSLEYAGHYLFSQRALDVLVESPHKGLHEFVAHLQSVGQALEYVSGSYLDIGTPEDLAKAPEFLTEVLSDHHPNPDEGEPVRRRLGSERMV